MSFELGASYFEISRAASRQSHPRRRRQRRRWLALVGHSAITHGPEIDALLFASRGVGDDVTRRGNDSGQDESLLIVSFSLREVRLTGEYGSSFRRGLRPWRRTLASVFFGPGALGCPLPPRAFPIWALPGKQSEVGRRSVGVLFGKAPKGGLALGLEIWRRGSICCRF